MAAAKELMSVLHILQDAKKESDEVSWLGRCLVGRFVSLYLF